MATKTEPRRMRAWQSHSSPAGDVKRGAIVTDDHPLYKAAPSMFVDHEKVQEWEEPGAYDRAVEMANDEQLAKDARKREAFKGLAKGNRVKLEARVYKCREDFATTINGTPTLVLKGSTVAEGDPVRVNNPERWTT